MRQIFLFMALLIPVTVNAQNKFETVDRKKIQSAVKKSSGKEYKSVVERFNRFDTTLTLDDYRLIYYGFAFQKSYNGYADHRRKDIVEAIDKKDFKMAVAICDSVLADIPISLIANYWKGIALAMEKDDKELARPYLKRFYGLQNAILSSGDGLECETAFKVLYIPDEYNLMYKYFEVKNFKGQALVGNCDRMNIDPSDFFDTDHMYFDASELLMNLQKTLRGK